MPNSQARDRARPVPAGTVTDAPLSRSISERFTLNRQQHLGHLNPLNVLHAIRIAIEGHLKPSIGYGRHLVMISNETSPSVSPQITQTLASASHEADTYSHPQRRWSYTQSQDLMAAARAQHEVRELPTMRLSQSSPALNELLNPARHNPAVIVSPPAPSPTWQPEVLDLSRRADSAAHLETLTVHFRDDGSYTIRGAGRLGDGPYTIREAGRLDEGSYTTRGPVRPSTPRPDGTDVSPPFGHVLQQSLEALGELATPPDGSLLGSGQSSPIYDHTAWTVTPCMFDGTRYGTAHVASSINEFLLNGRITDTGGYALTYEPPGAIDASVVPEEPAGANQSPPRFPATLAGRTPVNPTAVDLQPVKVVANNLDELSSVVVSAEVQGPTNVGARAAEAIGREDVIPRVYQVLLGTDAVFKSDEQWNIATPSGVIEMQSRLKLSNLTIAMFPTKETTYVYFAEDLDPHAAGAPRLHIHDLMEGASVVHDGPLTIVDARRHISLVEDMTGEGSAFARVHENVPSTVPSVEVTAESAIVGAVRLDEHGASIFDRVHVNRLVENEQSCTPMLVALSEVTNRTVDYAYLRDTGIQTANSPSDVIRGFQSFGATVNKFRNQYIVSHHAGMEICATELLTTDILSTLAKGLQHANIDSKETRELTYKCAANYLDLLEALVAENILDKKAVWDALKTAEGQHFTSMLGRRAGYEKPLGTALVGLLDRLRLKDLWISSISSLLAARPKSEHQGFFRELADSLKGKNKAPHAQALKDILVAKQYVSESAMGRSRSGYFRSIFNRPFRALRPETLRRHEPFGTESAPRPTPVDPGSTEAPAATSVLATLDTLRTNLSHDAMVTMAQTNFRTQLHELMPTMPMAEQRAFRNLITSSMDEAWQKELPNQHPSSRQVSSVLAEVGPGYANRITETRKAHRDRIIEDAVKALGIYLQDHPNASREQVSEAYKTICNEVQPEYQALVGIGAEKSDGSEERLTAYAAGEASTSAAAIKVQREAQAASLATAAAAAAHETSRREAETNASRAVQRAAQESRARSQKAAQESARATAAVAARATKTAEKNAEKAAKEKARLAALSSRNQATLQQRLTTERLRSAQATGGTLSHVSSMSSIFSWGASSVTSSEVNAVLRDVLNPRPQGFSVVEPLPSVPFREVGSHRFVFSPKTPSPVPATN